jgi:cytochrome c-type biogenesis protein
MMALVGDFLASFGLGLLTPLTAVCVLPLYPGFLAYLSNRFDPNEEGGKRRYAMFGLLVTLGVILFMFVLGLLFTTVLQVSLTAVIGIVSPIAFGILLIISVLLIFNIDMGKFIPKIKTPGVSEKGGSSWSALIYGFFFGAIVIPCNPGFIAAFLSRALLFGSFFESMLNFLFFGMGIGFPLLMFSLVSVQWSQGIIGFLTRRKRVINLFAGLIMLGISVYYLFFVFRVHELVFG